MALFIVRHQHDAERCPAQDPYVGAMLLNHLSRPNVRQHGVEIQGEAVVQGEHTLYLIVEADDERGVLRSSVPHWLEQPDLATFVLSYSEAPRRLGGEGALYVRLRAAKRR